MICVSLGNIDFQSALKVAETAGMIEIRGDLLSWSREEYAMIIGMARKSVFTYRSGEHETETERLDIYRFAVDNGADYIDIEMDASPEFIKTLRQYTRNLKTEMVISYHNFDETPSVAEMKVIMGQCLNSGADVVKIATMVNEYADAAGLLSLYREPGRKVILGMGEKGKIVRIASEFLGGEFTFAAPDKGGITAPGQLTVSDMELIINMIKPI